MSTPAHRATVLTPASTGGIALVRLHGSEPATFLKPLIRDSHTKFGKLQSGRLAYCQIMDGAEILDDVIVGIERAAAMEHAIDICCHGGTRIVQRILELLQQEGATIESGSPVAFDYFGPATSLIELEAMEALIGAGIRRAAIYAARLRCELPDKIEQLIRQFELAPATLSCALEELSRDFRPATTLLHGLSLALIGPPNSGKSTLFNRFIGRQASVTSPVPGTTRDWVSESVEFSGVHVELIDTAGRHAAEDELERKAIEVGKSFSDTSHAALLVLDGSAPLPGDLLDQVPESETRVWVVANKSDLGCCWAAQEIELITQHFGTIPARICAQRGDGCDGLKQSILEHFGLADPRAPAVSFFTSRQMDLVDQIRIQPNHVKSLLSKLLGSMTGVPGH